jgi:hypothetical protein
MSVVPAMKDYRPGAVPDSLSTAEFNNSEILSAKSRMFFSERRAGCASGAHLVAS